MVQRHTRRCWSWHLPWRMFKIKQIHCNFVCIIQLKEYLLVLEKDFWTTTHDCIAYLYREHSTAKNRMVVWVVKKDLFINRNDVNWIQSFLLSCGRNQSINLTILLPKFCSHSCVIYFQFIFWWKLFKDASCRNECETFVIQPRYCLPLALSVWKPQSIL